MTTVTRCPARPDKSRRGLWKIRNNPGMAGDSPIQGGHIRISEVIRVARETRLWAHRPRLRCAVACTFSMRR
jgi:hypothetical protein